MITSSKKGIITLIIATFFLALMDGMSRYMAELYDVLNINMFRFWIIGSFVILVSLRGRGVLRSILKTKQPVAQISRGLLFISSILIAIYSNTQVGLIAFGDRFEGEEPQILSFAGEPFTKDTNSFETKLGKMEMVGGGDNEESSLDALVLGARQPFREDATKAILLITDAPPKIPDKETASIAAAEKFVRDEGIDQLHLVISDKYRSIFQPLQREISGEIFSLAKTATARQNFDKILPEIGEKIASAIGTGEVSRDQKTSLIIATSLWTALLAIGTFIALTTGQKRYLGTSLNSVFVL